MEFLPGGITMGTSSGAVPRPPVAYGQYEVGRSSWQQTKNPKSPFTSPSFADGMTQQILPGTVLNPPQGDPGAYDPYYYEDAGTNPEFNSNSKNRKPFDSTSERKFPPTIFGLDTPSIGQYPVFLPEKTIGSLDDNLRYPKVDANVSVFRSGSLQRPNAKTFVPGPDHYKPNHNAIMKAPENTGHFMQSKSERFFELRNKSNTDEEVGPGSYPGAEYEATLQEDCEEAIRRSSQIKPGFGTTTPQRKLPFYAQGTPAPGAYEPLGPRLKDLDGEARRQVM